LPVIPQTFCDVPFTHTSCGSGAPSGTATHRPSVLVWLQAMQAPEQAELQHTPWAQKPDSHSLPALQAAPGFFFPHEESTQ
jgi:hypothetical protein